MITHVGDYIGHPAIHSLKGLSNKTNKQLNDGGKSNNVLSLTYPAIIGIWG